MRMTRYWQSVREAAYGHGEPEGRGSGVGTDGDRYGGGIGSGPDTFMHGDSVVGSHFLNADAGMVMDMISDPLILEALRCL